MQRWRKDSDETLFKDHSIFTEQDDPEFIKPIFYIDFLIWVWWLWVWHSELNKKKKKRKKDDGTNGREKEISKGGEILVVVVAEEQAAA